VIDAKLTVEYSYGDDKYQGCIKDKKYHGLKQIGHIGISSGNPYKQNVNEIDVYSIDFFNLNPTFYQLGDSSTSSENGDGDENTVTDYVSDNGFMGKKSYPESAKLNTIAMGKVAFDVFEYKRLKREFRREQFKKSLNIIKKDDDFSEMMIKLFEQVKLLNDGLDNHLEMQTLKKDTIIGLEDKLLTEEMYNHLLQQVRDEDTTLVAIS